MKRWILAGVLGMTLFTSGCVVRANYYRRPYDRNYRYYDYNRDYPAERHR